MSLETCVSLVATLPSYLGIPGLWPRENKFKNMENHERIYLKTWTMYVFFVTTMCFYTFFHERRADGAPLFMRAHFSIGTSHTLISAPSFVYFSCVRNKWSNEIRVLSYLWHLIIFPRAATYNYAQKKFLRAHTYNNIVEAALLMRT